MTPQPDCFTLTPALEAILFAHLEAMEGRVPHIYPDSKGNPTIGVGHLLSSPMDGLRLPLWWRKTHERASEAQVKSGWTFVREQRLPYTQIFMEEPDITELLRRDVASCQFTLRRTFGTTLGLAMGPVVALYDMALNLGSFAKFPKLRTAVCALDFKTAAEECQRKQVGDRRNDLTRKYLLGGMEAA
jgi:GH24 family phage-related lysozyme (muramidase)